MPNETTILRFRLLTEEHKLAEQILALVNELLHAKGLLLRACTVVDATLIAAPSSPENKQGRRDPEIHQGEKGEQWHFDKRPIAKPSVCWNIAMRPGKRKSLGKNCLIDELAEHFERLKASIRAKVEHPLRVIQRQWGHVKVRYRGLPKNTAQLHTLFALSNFWMVRDSLLGTKG